MTFGTIPLSEADAGKTYTYTISETTEFGGAWTKTGDITATVAVEDKGDGTVEATVTYSPESQTITNSYSATGETSLVAKKAITGAAWPAGKSVVFTLTGSEGAPMPAEGERTKTLTAAGTVTFGTIPLSEADAGKTYTYTISETTAFGGAWTKTEDITATVKVEDKGDGTVEATVTYSPESQTITNSYSATGSTQLKAKKAITGAAWPAGQSIVFTLMGTGDAPMPAEDEQTITLTAPGEGEFGVINLNETHAGKTYTYTIRETTGFVGGDWTNSGDITATVEVEDKGDGTVEATVTYSPENDTITNTHATGDLKVTKTAESSVAADTDTEFNFTVTLDDETITGTYGDMEFTAGVATFTLTDGDSATAESLPTGIGYTVVEEGNDNFTAEWTGETGEIVEAGCTAECTNTRKLATLTVTKTWDWDIGDISDEAKEALSITITGTNIGGAGVNTLTITYANFTDGCFTVEDLPVGEEYAVEETNADGLIANYTLVAEESTTATEEPVILAPGGSTVELTNIYERNTGSLKIKKTVTVNGDETDTTLVDGTYTFTIQSIEGVDPETTKVLKIEIENGEVASAVLDDDELLDPDEDGWVIISGLPTGGYTVTEDETGLAANGIKVTQSPTGVINVKKDGTSQFPTEVEFTNDKLTIQVQKTDVATGEELTGARIQILDKDGNIVDEWISNADEPHVVTKVRRGEEYILHEEVAPPGYLLTSDTHFTIDEDGNVVPGWTDTRAENANDGTPIVDGILLVQDQMKTTARIHKVWEDNNNSDGLRPASIEVELQRTTLGVEPADTTTILKKTLDSAGGWYAAVTDLPLTDREGRLYVYTWKEPAIDGYELSLTSSDASDAGIVISGQNAATDTLTTLTNVHTAEKTKVSVRKVWEDGNNAGSARPASIGVQLYADGIALGEAVLLNADNSWKHTWDELAVNVCENGAKRAISYTVAETEIPEGYVCKVTGNAETGFVITNSRGKLVIEKEFDFPGPEIDEEDELTDIEVQKLWEGDNDNADGNRPASIMVRLYADGHQIKAVRLTAGTGWKYHFTDLPKYKDGKLIHYSVSEDPVEGYTTTVEGFTIRNRYQPEVTQVTVRKVWNDENNKQGIRPVSIWMKLSNGMTVVLNEANAWTATITNLPTRINGQAVTYTWTEQSVIGYELESVEQEGNVTVFTNKPWTRPDQPSQGRKPKTPGETVYVFEDYDTPLGIEVVINHVGDCFD